MTEPKYYKATQLDGTDFRTGTVDYASALTGGTMVVHPDMNAPLTWAASDVCQSILDAPLDLRFAATYLSVSAEPAETLLGGRWPCRLFEVEPVGGAWMPANSFNKHKRACRAVRVTRELPAHMALGPNGEQVAAFLARVSELATQKNRETVPHNEQYEFMKHVRPANLGRPPVHAAWNAASSFIYKAIPEDCVIDCGDGCECNPSYEFVYGLVLMARALVVRHLIPAELFDSITSPWADVVSDLPA